MSVCASVPHLYNGENSSALPHRGAVRRTRLDIERGHISSTGKVGTSLYTVIPSLEFAPFFSPMPQNLPFLNVTLAQRPRLYFLSPLCSLQNNSLSPTPQYPLLPVVMVLT
uniref:Uncharacterized protein n=1 Tax=Chelonoidis abingdonii TaxID=106734 RepID=A0A8C0JEP0_CHEAB